MVFVMKTHHKLNTFSPCGSVLLFNADFRNLIPFFFVQSCFFTEPTSVRLVVVSYIWSF